KKAALPGECLTHIQGSGRVVLQKILDSLNFVESGDSGSTLLKFERKGLVGFKLADQYRRMSRQDHLPSPLISCVTDRLGEYGDRPRVERRLRLVEEQQRIPVPALGEQRRQQGEQLKMSVGDA